MTEILTQQEIDQLLTAICADDQISSFENISIFEKYLKERKHIKEKPYGIFDTDISICGYFNSANNERILQDIKLKNESQGFENITIPNTNITLLNYSFCQKCNTIYSYQDITNYYKNPQPDQRYRNRAHQFRTDTRVHCNNCGAYFLPSLIISDGTPQNEVQFLCRVQTIDAVEEYFIKKNIRVLTKKRKNIVISGNNRAIKNDVFIKDLEEKPTLITNIIQYTPYNYIMNLIDGTNVEKGDLLFNEWKNDNI
jgi:F0F1-type ATP synthase gamma subunit